MAAFSVLSEQGVRLGGQESPRRIGMRHGRSLKPRRLASSFGDWSKRENVACRPVITERTSRVLTALTDHSPNPFLNALAHPMVTAATNVRFGKRHAEWKPEMVPTARRLIAAYKFTISQEKPPRFTGGDDLWSALTRENFGQMLSYIQAEDADQLSRYLVDFGREYTWFGGISTGVDGHTHWNLDESFVACSYFDKLICLGESLGVLSMESPEQGTTARSDAIKLKATWNCVDEAEGALKIAANQDPFPEISGQIFGEYVRQLRRIAPDYFLSINHEGEQLIDGERLLHASRLLSAERCFRRIHRSPYWLRKGYVEELYRIERGSSALSASSPRNSSGVQRE